MSERETDKPEQGDVGADEAVKAEKGADAAEQKAEVAEKEAEVAAKEAEAAEQKADAAEEEAAAARAEAEQKAEASPEEAAAAEARAEDAERKADEAIEEELAAKEKAEAARKEAEAAEEDAVAKGKKANAGPGKSAGDDKAGKKKKKSAPPVEEVAAAATPLPAARSVEKHVDDEEARPAAPAIIGAPYGLMGYFTTPADLFHACESLRDAGYVHFDAHTPFPVHGLEKAMGLKASRLPWFVLLGGFTGLSSAIALAWYTQAYDYPLSISGKLPFSYQVFVPIFFELTILFSALTCFVAVWAFGKLPTFSHPTMTHPAFPRATDDAFFISVEARDPKYDAGSTRRLLEKLGALDVQEVAQ
ncbi:DUF3341 domain-containing protein [Chondromyces crocatus]|uniref:DUF3341 domain-containing protein n=1 Tax=Chondromyces crocatus TaxID=52 RepID=A0A0K1ESM2_CHOCO|nr:DUF3341 domain-containing protein [Chondromyces crocatus]AKT43935.1 uncharacterized protein CMC5_081720 [Chondromyces crocatus]